jgi:hypothetical protein
MADLQGEVLHGQKNIDQTNQYLKERPDLMINRIVGHIQYLLEVKSVDGILPTVNRMYVFQEEMKNFLNTIRSLLGLDRNIATAVIIDEVLTALTRLKIKQTTTTTTGFVAANSTV